MVASRPTPDTSASFRRARQLNPVGMDKLRRDLSIPTISADRVIELMTRCTSAAVELVSGVDHAGVTATLDSTPFTVAPTDPLVGAFDDAQYIFGDGPCLRASRSGHNVRMSLSELEGRWPGLGTRARAAQLTEFLAIPLFAQETPVGSLNLYSRESIDNSIHGLDLVTVLAEYLGSALDVAADDAQRGRAATVLRDAVAARVDIDRAVGVLMHQNDFDASLAFRELEARASADSGNILKAARQVLASLGDGSA